MLAKSTTCAVVGLDGFIVQVEVDISPGLPAFTIVGLPDTAVQEARERVRAAIRNSGGEFPMRRVTVNLAPADLRKAGPAYDLPIAISVLLSSGQVPSIPESALFLGELSLDGGLRHTNGILPMVAVARDEGFQCVFVPALDAAEAALVDGIDVYGVGHLNQLISHFRGDDVILPIKADVNALVEDAHPLNGAGINPGRDTDLADVRGQEHAKRALEVAASGGHNLLMSGPPGSGKTLLARALPSVLPRLTRNEALDVTKIYSVGGLLPNSSPLISQRPFRAPHYTISNAGLVGGGRMPRPGEVTLSHRGVLFLDELPEFGHTVLEVLRQPLEDKMVTISRAQGTTSFPANFMLVAAMNPCPCGYYSDPIRECTCSSNEVARYKRRISGPLLDRIDMFVEVPRVDYEKLTQPSDSESSSQVRERVEEARQRQYSRFKDTSILTNAEMGPTEVWNLCQMDDTAKALLNSAMKQMQLSARGFHRILKVSRTIADLAGEPIIGIAHLAEALQYRPTGESL
ncbi:MAG: YifB family Mg chelatase-like AAA ATPase [Chloroflexi bacterium]|nr:YifB family Mg chelatase-like AAA ATPase [Chloroflexota bacterium]